MGGASVKHPAVTAEWTNGIHTSTIFADIDAQQYPIDNSINSFNQRANWTQKYSPVPDVTITGLVDYTHQTIASALTSAIPGTTTTVGPSPILLPDGNIQLPSGEIINSSGQVVGNISPTSANGQNLIVNPFDQYTTSLSASKIFNRAIISLNGSWAQTDYAMLQGTGAGAFSSFSSQTYGGSGSLWLTPILYGYSDGVISSRHNAEGINPDNQSYRVRGGLGTSEFGGFITSAYYGYQGSNSDTGQAGGIIFGGKVTYLPTAVWTLSATYDETVNKASGGPSMLALDIVSPVQVATSSSTRIGHSSLQSQYQIAPQWTSVANLSYTQIDYLRQRTA